MRPRPRSTTNRGPTRRRRRRQRGRRGCGSRIDGDREVRACRARRTVGVRDPGDPDRSVDPRPRQRVEVLRDRHGPGLRPDLRSTASCFGTGGAVHARTSRRPRRPHRARRSSVAPSVSVAPSGSPAASGSAAPSSSAPASASPPRRPRPPPASHRRPRGRPRPDAGASPRARRAEPSRPCDARPDDRVRRPGWPGPHPATSGRGWSSASCARAGSRTSASSRRCPRCLARRSSVADQRRLAYADEALPIAAGQTISQPYIVARMTELLGVGPGDRVLEIGTGSGYQAAVLAAMGCRVVTIERHADARGRGAGAPRGARLRRPVEVRVGDGSLGAPDGAPWRGILVAAAAPASRGAARAARPDGGRLVLPVGPRDRQRLLVVDRGRQRVDRDGTTAPVSSCRSIGAGGFARPR